MPFQLVKYYYVNFLWGYHYYHHHYHHNWYCYNDDDDNKMITPILITKNNNEDGYSLIWNLEIVSARHNAFNTYLIRLSENVRCCINMSSVVCAWLSTQHLLARRGVPLRPCDLMTTWTFNITWTGKHIIFMSKLLSTLPLNLPMVTPYIRWYKKLPSLFLHYTKVHKIHFIWSYLIPLSLKVARTGLHQRVNTLEPCRRPDPLCNIDETVRARGKSSICHELERREGRNRKVKMSRAVSEAKGELENKVEKERDRGKGEDWGEGNVAWKKRERGESVL